MVNWGALFVEYWSTIWIAFFETFDPLRGKDQKYGSDRESRRPVEISKQYNIRHGVGSELSLVFSSMFNIKDDSNLYYADLYRGNITCRISLASGKSVGGKPIFKTGFLFSSHTLHNYICI